MEDLCRFFIYFILFLALYQYFNKVVEGHNVQSTADCSSAQNRTDCRTKAPSCFWRDTSGKRASGASGTCVSTGSTSSASRYHSGNHHASDHNHPIDPSITQISGRVEDSGENQINLSGRAMCDTHTCPNNYVKREGVDNVFQGEDATQTCCRPVTCDTFECDQTSDPIDNSSAVNQFDPPNAPTELPQARCCTPKMCNIYTSCPNDTILKDDAANIQQGQNPQSNCCRNKTCGEWNLRVGDCNAIRSSSTHTDVSEQIYNGAYSPSKPVDPDKNIHQRRDICCVPRESKDLKCGSFRCPVIKYNNQRVIAMKRNPEWINRYRGLTPIDTCCTWDWGAGTPYQGANLRMLYYALPPSFPHRSTARTYMGLTSNDRGIKSCAGRSAHPYPVNHTKNRPLPSGSGQQSGPNGCIPEARAGLHSTSRRNTGND